MDNYAVSVVPGRGAVARWAAGVVVAGGEQSDALDLVAALQAAAGDEPTSASLIEVLRDSQFNADHVNVAAAVSTPDSLRVFVSGSMQVRTEANEVITGPSAVERDLPSPGALWLGAVDPPAAQAHPVMDLRQGVVMGEGVVLHRPMQEGSASVKAVTGEVAAGTPAAATGLSNAVQTTPELVVEPFAAVDWDEQLAIPPRKPLEVAAAADDVNSDGTPGNSADAAATPENQVLGIRCSRGHFNNPDAGYCQVCGISMVHLTRRLEPGTRPTLGFVVFADGATYAIDRPYLIGRNPQPAYGFTPLPTQDPTRSVSREHAELRLVNWDVTYVDLGSTNGSFLWNAGANRWDQIQPNNPVVLTSGSTVSVGRMTFVFEGASKPVTS